MRDKLIEIYNKLFERYSNQYWWPAATKEEVVIGAILTQNTSWSNVEKAIANLKQQKICSFEGIYNINIEQLKAYIKPAGFFNQKAEYLKNTAEFFLENGSIKGLKKQDTKTLRRQLLKIKGIGKETADSILLYALDKPVFVVDAYTKRLVKRHNLSKNTDYDSIQKLFEENLKKDTALFNEFHALIVRNAKEFCTKKPRCNGCPLEGV